MLIYQHGLVEQIILMMMQFEKIICIYISISLKAIMA